MRPINKVLMPIVLMACFLFANNLQAQNNSIVLDGAYIVLDGGTEANPIYVVVDQPDPDGITRLASGGHIHSENQYNIVKWLSGSNTGSYVFPFGVGGNSTDYIPFTFEKTAGSASISTSTWGTNVQNMPHPAATNVGEVTDMLGITDSVEYAIDRFWDIQATGTTADLTFSYRGVENTTSNPTGLVQAQHWNGNSWDAPVGPGTAGVTAGIGNAGPFVGQNTFSPWLLIVTCEVDLVTQDLEICQGESITVGTNTYSTTGTYIDELINVKGCDSIVTTNLTVNPIPTGTDVQEACGSFTWIDGVTYTSSNNTATHTLTAANGCDSIVTLDLTISSLPIVVNSTVINDNCEAGTGEISIEANSSNAPLTYVWSNGETGTDLTHLSEGIYQVTISDTASCSITTTFQVSNDMIDCGCFIYVANAFSPNGDNNNDFIPVRGKCVSSLSFKIFNRWGNLVFETNKLNDGWDGYYKGELQNSGIYVYVLKATLENGETVNESGDITLLR